MPIIGWVLHRIRNAKTVDQILFAIPNSSSDDILHDYLDSQGASVFRGSELDVLDRFYMASTSANASNIVRVCADNPLICADEVDRLVNFFKSHQCDYAYNHIPNRNTYPNGLGAEITSYDTLELVHKNAVLSSHREHMFNYILDNPERFSIKTFDPINPMLMHPELRFDIDNIEDYHRLLMLNLNYRCSSIEAVQAALNIQGIL